MGGVLMATVLIETELERVNTAITRWHYRHPECGEFVDQYHRTLDEIDRTVTDDEAYSHILLVNAMTEYRLLTGRKWESK